MNNFLDGELNLFSITRALYVYDLRIGQKDQTIKFVNSKNESIVLTCTYQKRGVLFLLISTLKRLIALKQKALKPITLVIAIITPKLTYKRLSYITYLKNKSLPKGEDIQGDSVLTTNLIVQLKQIRSSLIYYGGALINKINYSYRSITTS